jgi:hypothetical protein
MAGTSVSRDLEVHGGWYHTREGNAIPRSGAALFGSLPITELLRFESIFGRKANFSLSKSTSAMYIMGVGYPSQPPHDVVESAGNRIAALD